MSVWRRPLGPRSDEEKSLAVSLLTPDASSPDARRPTPDGVLDDLELRRLRWRSRRGLLENDIIIERFLRADGAGLRRTELDAFARLLELPDNDLLDLLLSRKEPDGELDSIDVRALLARLRTC